MIHRFTLLVCVTAVVLLAANMPAKADRPKILVIVADDLGWAGNLRDC